MHPLRASLIAHKSTCRSILGVEEAYCNRRNKVVSYFDALLNLLRTSASACSAGKNQLLQRASWSSDGKLGMDWTFGDDSTKDCTKHNVCIGY